MSIYYETSTLNLPGSPKALTCSSGASYSGYVDSKTCTAVSGWAADRNRLNTPITVTLWDGGTQIASALANASRPDVGGVLGDNGLHGFSLVLPGSYVNGDSRTLQVRYETSSLPVPNSLITTCGGTVVRNYTGWVDSASCAAITGWAADRNRRYTSIVVTLWDGETQIASTMASLQRQDVGGLLSDDGRHGFTLSVPASIATGTPHSLQVRYETSSTQLPGSPVTLTCGLSTPIYSGWIDSVSCSGISGWAADRARPNTPITVSLWDGTIQVASTTANAPRSDVGGVLGDNGLHGYSLAIPAGVADGTGHSLQVRYETSTAQLPGSPKTLTCAGAVGNYTGWVDKLSCTSISGWAADRNMLNVGIFVYVYDGSTFLFATTADSSRADVGGVLGDNGLHGFAVALPSSVRDGKAHVITVRPGNSTSPLSGQQMLTCQ